MATAIACLDPLRIEPVERTDDETARAIGRTHAGAFVRFLVVIFVATFVAYFLRGVFSVEAGAVVAVGSAGVALLVFASFGIALLGSMRGSFSFTSMYYPLILLLCAACLLLLVLEVANGALQAVVICLYSLTSLFSWCMLCYASKSDYWDPIQVFGWGRAAFALGSLVGIVAAGGAQTLAADAVADYLRVCGVVLALALIACAMVVFRERDIMAITKAAWLIEDARIRERTAAPVDDAPAAAQTFRAGASVGGDADDGSGTHGPTPDRAASFDQAASAVAAAPQRAEQAGDPTTVTVDDFADEHNLTRSEREVLPLMLEGRGSKSIGETLVISENTAKSHIRSIYAKCGVHTRTEFIDATAAVHR